MSRVETATAVRADSDAELSLVHTIIADPHQLELVAPILAPEAFARDQPRRFYTALLALREAGAPLVRGLIERELGDDGPQLFRWLDGTKPRTAGSENAVALATIIVRLAALRWSTEAMRVKLAEAEGMRITAGSNEAFEKWIGAAITELERLRNDPLNMAASLNNCPQGHKPYPDLGPPSGFAELDRCDWTERPVFRGWLPGYHVIAGRTGKGKTTYGLQCCVNLAARGFPCLVISVEMPQAQIFARLVENVIHANYQPHMAEAVRDNIKVWHPRSKRITIDDVAGQLSLFTAELGGRQPGMVLVDHLNHKKWRTVSGKGSEFDILSEVVDGLVNLSDVDRHSVAIVGLSQVSGSAYVEDAKKKPLELEHVYAKGITLNDAISVQLTHPQKAAGGGKYLDFHINLAKQRHGPDEGIKFYAKMIPHAYRIIDA